MSGSSSGEPDDDRLFEALRHVVLGVGDGPPEAVEAAKAAFTWRTVDAELAALTHDSWEAEPAGVRGGTPPARLLSFEAGPRGVEVEVAADRRLLGQLVPPGAGRVEVRHDGGSTAVTADELGRFRTEPLPEGPVRLRCETAAGVVETDWVLV